MENNEVIELIKQCIKENLSIEIKSETSDFHTTDGTTRTRFEVILRYDGEEISTGYYYQ